MIEDNKNISKSLIDNFATILKDIELDDEDINKSAQMIITTSDNSNDSLLEKNDEIYNKNDNL